MAVVGAESEVHNKHIGLEEPQEDHREAVNVVGELEYDENKEYDVA